MKEIEIIYQDKNLVIVNKPAGLLTHPIPAHKADEATLADWIKEKYPETKSVGDQPEIRPGIVHRLDKETSGLIVVALNQKTFEYLKKLFQTGGITKTYIGLVWGIISPKTGVINKPIGLKSGTIRRTTAIKNAKMVKPAVTEYQAKEYFKGFSLLEIRPRTGRTHQIRIHLNSIGHPIVGDPLYGKKPLPEGLKRQFLHAASLEFTLPESGRIKAETNLPTDLELFLKSLSPEENPLNK